MIRLFMFMQNMDMKLLQMIHSIFQNDLFDRLMPMITKLGDKGMIWIILAFGLLCSKSYRHVGILALLSLALSTLIGEGFIKHMIGRDRPFVGVPDIQLLIKAPITYSFPSGHTASSFAVAGVLANKLKKYKIPILCLATAIAFSRLYLFVHYPSDILAGVILGLGSASVILRLEK